MIRAFMSALFAVAFVPSGFAQTIDVTEPGSKEIYKAGDPVTVGWTASGIDGFVDIKLAPVGTGSVVPILSNIVSDASTASAVIPALDIETAKLSGVDPQAWLTDILGRIADHKITRLDELLPWRYAQVWSVTGNWSVGLGGHHRTVTAVDRIL